MGKENLIADISLDFSVRIVKLYKYLTEKQKEYVISKQLLRSGTSIGANIAEAQGAQSDADFIAKLHIALKDCRESEYWMKLLLKTEYLNETEYNSLKTDIDKIIGLLTNILKSVKQRINL
jgi:TIGR02436 family protein